MKIDIKKSEWLWVSETKRKFLVQAYPTQFRHIFLQNWSQTGKIFLHLLTFDVYWNVGSGKKQQECGNVFEQYDLNLKHEWTADWLNLKINHTFRIPKGQHFIVKKTKSDKMPLFCQAWTIVLYIKIYNCYCLLLYILCF